NRERAHTVVLEFEEPFGAVEGMLNELRERKRERLRFERVPQLRRTKPLEFTRNAGAGTRSLANLLQREAREHRARMRLQDVLLGGVFVALLYQQPLLFAVGSPALHRAVRTDERGV